jgi:predicted neutral ceramidase superfamily lipid hydrolase
MILGMSTATYTFLHVLISLVGIGTGRIVMFGFLNGRRREGMNTLFLITTVLTSVTGFGFPFDHLLPSHILGIISLVVLPIAIPARYVFHLDGTWRRIYVITASIALYLNVFVLVAQSFMKVPALNALAPTQKEPPFLIAQLVVMFIFIGLTTLAVKRFRSDLRSA